MNSSHAGYTERGDHHTLAEFASLGRCRYGAWRSSSLENGWPDPVLCMCWDERVGISGMRCAPNNRRARSTRERRPTAIQARPRGQTWLPISGILTLDYSLNGRPCFVTGNNGRGEWLRSIKLLVPDLILAFCELRAILRKRTGLDGTVCPPCMNPVVFDCSKGLQPRQNRLRAEPLAPTCFVTLKDSITSNHSLADPLFWLPPLTRIQILLASIMPSCLLNLYNSQTKWHFPPAQS